MWNLKVNTHTNGLLWILLLFSFYLSSRLPRRFSCPLYHVLYPTTQKKNPPKLDDVIIFATTYIAVGSTTTFVDGASTITSIDPKEINTPVCSIGFHESREGHHTSSFCLCRLLLNCFVMHECSYLL
jgi:hypothetical protein